MEKGIFEHMYSDALLTWSVKITPSFGITDIEIHFIHVKFYSIKVYLESEVVGHLEQFKGKSTKELEDNDEFFNALISGKL
ncbi:hypothetical protein JHK85_027936 [Glycine max]|nr:hypothetical protein JHK85_027936 [Glycine max]KAG5003287.1 hypothetical protein JHK86_027426 [Glycine max]